MLYMNSNNIVHGSKKKSWKHVVHLRKLSEKIEFYYELVVAPPVVTMHNPFMLIWFSLRNLCDVTDGYA